MRENKQIKISAVLATKNEEKMLEGCLKSLDWVDEIIVVDTGSIDKTVSIAKKYKAKVIEYKTGKTFSDWRNRELKEAHGQWVLYIDADERVPEKLKNEIVSIINSQTQFSWYVFPRSNKIFGKEFRHGGWWPDYVKRLYRKDALVEWHGDLHEEPVVKGEMGKTENYLLHIKHETLFEMVEKTNKWSAIEGKLMFDAGHPPMTVVRFLSAMWREFFRRMIAEMAFLDGRKGIMMAIYQVFSRFTSYAKLWELQQK